MKISINPLGMGAFLQPHTNALSSLFRPMACCIVRMIQLDSVDNRGMHGEMIWPEVLVCMDPQSAEVLKDFLNIQSFQDSRNMWLEAEPYLTEQEMRRRWEKEDTAQYVVESVSDLSKYSAIELIPESIAVAKELFEELRLD